MHKHRKQLLLPLIYQYDKPAIKIGKALINNQVGSTSKAANVRYRSLDVNDR